MPVPPQWLQEWAPIAWPVIVVLGLPVARAVLVQPILRVLKQHAEQHDRMDLELTANGSEYLLPPEERGLPLRTLLIKNHAVFLEHKAQTDPLIEEHHRVVQDVAALRERMSSYQEWRP